MALNFSPPEWLIKEYMNRKTPGQQVLEGAQGAANLYLQKKQLTQQKESEGLGSILKAYEAGGPDLANQVAQQLGVKNPLTSPGATPPAQTGTVPPTGQPMEPQMSGPVQGPQLPGVGLTAASQTPRSGMGSPIIAAWSSMQSQSQTPVSPPSPSATSPLGLPPEVGSQFEKFGNMGKYGEKQRQGLMNQMTFAKGLKDLENDPNAPVPVMTREDALKAGSVNPRAKIIDEGPQATRDRETTIRLSNEFSQQSKEFRLAGQSLPAVMNASPDAAGDMQMIFGLMKIYDPTSVVRETEFANAENARGVPDTIRATWNKVRKGERLSPQQRQQFQASARNVYEGRLSQQKQLENEFRRQGASFGLNPDQIIRDYAVPGLPPLQQQQSPSEGGLPSVGGSASEVVRTTKDGKKAVFDANTKQFIRWAQ